MKPQFLLFLFILEKTKYLKVGHYLEPSRCKTTSTVTFSLKIQTSTRILFQSIREHNIPNTVYDLQKKRQNPNIQPYKIIPHTSGPLLSALVAGREAAVCVHVQMIFTLLFTKFIFAKLKQFFFLWMVLEAQPQSLWWGLQLVQFVWLPQTVEGLDVRRVSIYLFIVYNNDFSFPCLIQRQWTSGEQQHFPLGAQGLFNHYTPKEALPQQKLVQFDATTPNVLIYYLTYSLYPTNSSCHSPFGIKHFFKEESRRNILRKRWRTPSPQKQILSNASFQDRIHW